METYSTKLKMNKSAHYISLHIPVKDFMRTACICQYLGYMWILNIWIQPALQNHMQQTSTLLQNPFQYLYFLPLLSLPIS